MEGEFTIAFYNVENLFDTRDDPGVRDEDFTPEGEKLWTEERYKKKLDHIAQVFHAIDDTLPLIIGLCEVENKGVLEDLTNLEVLTSANYQIIHYSGRDARGIDVALLYKKDYFNVKDIRSIPVVFDGRPEVLTRNILHVEGIIDNEILHVFVNHWSSKGKGEAETEWKRIETAQILREHIGQVLNNHPKAKIIIMGDFNEDPDNIALKKYLEAGDPVKSPFLYNTAYSLFLKGIGTHYFEEWSMLDQMIVSKELYLEKDGLRLKDKNQQILREGWLFYETSEGKFPDKTYSGDKYHGGYSDHLPVYLKLQSN